MENGTGFTQLMFDMATSKNLTLEQAVEQLKQDAHVRTVRETLAKYAGIPEEDKKALRSFLTDALLANSPPGTDRGSIERKIRMWIGDGVRTLSKQSAIQLCFALRLSVEDGGEFLCRVCGENFHWRNPREIVYIYALGKGLNYVQALELCQEMERKGLLNAEGGGSASASTELVKRSAEQIWSEDELEEYLRESQGLLGTLHNTAYELFRQYLGLLSVPETNDHFEQENKFSVREITDTYLHEKLIPRIQKRAKKNTEGSKRAFSALQRDIHQNWPDETALSRMLNRKIDVSRKALILLFLATDGDTLQSVQEDADWELQSVRRREDEMDEEDWDDEDSDWAMDEEEGFETLYMRMNSMLADCGFPKLDSRTPFDWMVLYCMCADESILIDGRVQSFLTEIFQDDAPEGDG